MFNLCDFSEQSFQANVWTLHTSNTPFQCSSLYQVWPRQPKQRSVKTNAWQNLIHYNNIKS